MYRKALVLGGLAAILCSGQAAFAHHAINSEFDVVHLVPMQGVLLSLEPINPHTYWHFAVTGADGKVSTWTIEGVAPGVLRRAGVALKTDLKVGDTYKIIIAPGLQNSASLHVGLMHAIWVNGKEHSMTAEAGLAN